MVVQRAGALDGQRSAGNAPETQGSLLSWYEQMLSLGQDCPEQDMMDNKTRNKGEYGMDDFSHHCDTLMLKYSFVKVLEA